jgi:hypothetical protein
MSDHDVFKEQPIQPEQTSEDLLASIKNENGEQKYRTVDEAIKALAHSQAFIPQLQSEKKQLEEETIRLREIATKASAIDEVLDKLRTQGSEQKPTEKETPSGGGLSEDQVTQLVRRALEEQQKSAKVTDNVTRVNNELISRFGGNKTASEAIAARCLELNTTPEQLKILAADSPDLVLSLFATDKTKPSQPTLSGQISQFGKPLVEVPSPNQSILTGATSREQKEYYLKVKDEVFSKMGVVS